MHRSRCANGRKRGARRTWRLGKPSGRVPSSAEVSSDGEGPRALGGGMKVMLKSADWPEEAAAAGAEAAAEAWSAWIRGWAFSSTTCSACMTPP